MTLDPAVAGDLSIPPAHKPLVELDVEHPLSLPSVKLPKSIASPVDAIVIYSITSVFAEIAPPHNPRIPSPQALHDMELLVVDSPKYSDLPLVFIFNTDTVVVCLDFFLFQILHDHFVLDYK